MLARVKTFLVVLSVFNSLSLSLLVFCAIEVFDMHSSGTRDIYVYLQLTSCAMLMLLVMVILGKVGLRCNFQCYVLL